MNEELLNMRRIGILTSVKLSDEEKFEAFYSSLEKEEKELIDLFVLLQSAIFDLSFKKFKFMEVKNDC